MMAPSIKSVTFDTTGMQLHIDEGDHRIWTTEDGDQLTLRLVNLAWRPVPVPNSIDQLRQFARKAFGDIEAAIVEVEPAVVSRRGAVSMIAKRKQEPVGISYLGWLILPFREFYFEIRVLAVERGMTGMRDAMVFQSALNDGTVEWEEDEVRGWMKDPYDPDLNVEWGYNPADDAEHDEYFPGHPLSRVRRTMAHCVSTMRLFNEAGTAEPLITWNL